MEAYETHRDANGGADLNYYNCLLFNSKYVSCILFNSTGFASVTGCEWCLVGWMSLTRIFGICVTQWIHRNKKMQLDAKAYNLVDDGDDMQVKEDPEAATREKTCTNSGCRATYTDATNNATACWYHPGSPVFHEGRKGWKCCSKRVDDFEEAMSLPGCTLGAHHSRPPAIKTATIQNRPVDPEYLPKSSVNGVETFQLDGAMPMPSSKDTVSAVSPAPAQIIEEPDDPMDAVIAVGTKCRHHGCHETFQDDASRTAVCTYHPGLPVFHEGSKYWTCCKPRHAEFEQFLKIPGCKQGRHKFCPKPGDAPQDPQQVNCRYDFYQQGDSLFVSVYGKNMDRDTSKITYQDKSLQLRIEFKDGKHYYKDLELFAQINPTHCSHNFLTTKVEIKLAKAAPMVWPRLELKEPDAPSPNP